MDRTRLSLIVAMDRNSVIGRDGDLPWHLSSDLKRFKKLTMGHHLIMGRKTFESIGRLLPGRTTVVITRQSHYNGNGAVVVASWQAAAEVAGTDEEAFIVGGAEIYRLALPHVDRIYLTEVAAEVTGDTCFPDFDRTEWHVVEQTQHAASDRDDFDHTFCILDRRVVD